jgi:DNA adenine methylase
VLLAREPSRSETVVERNPDQVVVLRAVRDHPRELRRRLWGVRWCEETWREARERLREGEWDSDLEWAATSYTFRRLSWGGCSGYSDNPGRWEQGWWLRGVRAIPLVAERLKGVRIVSGDGTQHLGQLDHWDAVHYLDPPYLGASPGLYGRYSWGPADHERLLDLLVGLRGRVCLSGYDSPLYRDRLAGWRTASLVTRCFASDQRDGRPRPRRTEWLWMNY